MGEVWGLALPREQKYVLIALADHADHEGCHVFPSVGLVAWKTDYSDRQIRRILEELERIGAIVPTNRQQGQVTEYRIDLARIARKEARSAKRGRPVKVKGGAEKTDETDPEKTPDILTHSQKTPDISAQNPGHFDTGTPDILTQTPDMTHAGALPQARGTVLNRPLNHPKQQHTQEAAALPICFSPIPAGCGEEEAARKEEAAAAVLCDFVSRTVRELQRQGVDADEDTLRQSVQTNVTRYGEPAVARQVQWLPRRTGERRLRVLAAALRDGYEDPDAERPRSKAARPAPSELPCSPVGSSSTSASLEPVSLNPASPTHVPREKPKELPPEQVAGNKRGASLIRENLAAAGRNFTGYVSSRGQKPQEQKG